MPEDTKAFETYTREKDAIAFLGLMSYMYANWDPPIRTDAAVNDDTHYHGLNICGLIVDNLNGEVLAMEKNCIHEYNSPVEHGEQRALRAAIARLHVKRPRGPDTTVEEYYRSQMFYADGNTPQDYVYQGCTLYTSLEPCPMCTATLCVCRMKRIVYCVRDDTYGGSWNWRGQPQHGGIKDRYYSSYELTYGSLQLAGESSGIAAEADRHYQILMSKIGADSSAKGSFRAQAMFDTLFFDHLHPELEAIANYFQSIEATDLITQGSDRVKNLTTLSGLKALCNIPFLAQEARATTATAGTSL